MGQKKVVADDRQLQRKYEVNNLIYNTIFQLIATLTNVIGTTYAILSILKLKPRDLYTSITIGGMDKNDETLLTQKKQARIGISLVIYAWFVQVVFSFLEVQSFKWFVIYFVAYIIITAILCIYLIIKNKNFAKKYDEYKKGKEKEDNDRHSDSHIVHEF